MNWKPIRRGKTYCSPACGAGCTHAEYLKAKSDSAAVIEQLKTKGWKSYVWENMGWHWTLVNARCGISLHKTDCTDGRSYWCMCADGDTKETTNGSVAIDCGDSFKDPNKAVANAIKIATKFFEAQARGFENLKSIQK